MMESKSINLEEMKKDPGVLTKETVEEIIKPYTEAKKAFNKAASAYMDDVEAKEDKIRGKREQMRARLEELAALSEKLACDIADYISSGEDEKAQEAERQMDEATAEMYSLEKKIQQFQSISIKGDDDLFNRAAKAYSLMEDKRHDATATAREIVSIAKRWIEYFSQIRDSAYNIAYGNTASGRRREDDIMVKIDEQHCGSINVDGHSAGSDMDAKIRFVKGNIRGIENTEAAKRLEGISDGK